MLAGVRQALPLVALALSVYPTRGSVAGARAYVGQRQPRYLRSSPLKPLRNGLDRRLVGRYSLDVAKPDIQVQTGELSSPPDVDGRQNETGLGPSGAVDGDALNASGVGALENSTDEDEVVLLGLRRGSDLGWGFQALAAAGALDCAYLTATKLGQAELLCPASSLRGCSQVLNSEWGSVGEVPLPVFGFLAYVMVAALSFKPDALRQQILWWLTFAMTAMSGVLMLVLILVLHKPCIWCGFSAFVSSLLFALVEGDRARVAGQRPRLIVLGYAAGVAAAAVKAVTQNGGPYEEDEEPFEELSQRYKPEHPPVRTHSSPAELALARHLKAEGAVCYAAWWCPHCQEQRENFGIEAVAIAPFVQCAAENRKQLKECEDISGYPTWKIYGKDYRGLRDLSELAEITGFTLYPKEVFQNREDSETAYIWR